MTRVVSVCLNVEVEYHEIVNEVFSPGADWSVVLNDGCCVIKMIRVANVSDSTSGLVVKATPALAIYGLIQTNPLTKVHQ